MKLGKLVVVAHEGAVKYGTVSEMTTTLHNGKERVFVLVKTEDGECHRRNEDDVLEIEPWGNDSQVVIFLQNHAGCDWATRCGKKMLETKEPEAEPEGKPKIEEIDPPARVLSDDDQPL